MNKKGFIQILIIFLILAGIGVFIIQKNLIFKNQESQSSNSSIQTATVSAQIESKTATSAALSTINPTSTPKVSSKPSAAKTSVLRNVTITGFTYEDRNNNGIFDSDDPKLPNVELAYKDSLSNMSQPYGYWSDLSGNVYLSLDVTGDLVVTPKAGNNYVPRSQQTSYNKSASEVKFGYRSASAPTGNNVGILEGDVYHDSNRNLSRDGGESGVSFYKFYVQDSEGNYYDGYYPDEGGHFKFINLPLGKTYTIRLSNPTGAFIIDRAETPITLSSTNPQNTNLQIPVYKVGQ